MIEPKRKQMIGKQSLYFNDPPSILAAASIVGEKEGEGPLGQCFDKIIEDPMFGQDSWEEAESRFIEEACKTVMEKLGLKGSDIRYLFGGDLLGQLIATTFGTEDFKIPLFGLYGACSTSGEALSLAAMVVAAGFASRTLAVTSSHFAAAEKTFRFPLEYGNQRPLSATWTVTGSGAFIVGKSKSQETGNILIRGLTTGKVVDYGVKDALNMGACMAPAAADVIFQNLEDFGMNPEDYDKIITGDLGMVGKEILHKLLKDNGKDISENHMDCGLTIYDNIKQDTHSGGSGCGCAATTLASYIMPKLKSGEWKRVLFVPTGALLSPISFNEGQTVPGIAHGIVLERS